MSGEEESALFDSGGVGGAESSAAYLPTLPRPGVITGNLTPYAKANVLLANSAAFAALSDHQQDVLRRAAGDTLAHSLDTRTSDADDLAVVCGQGLQVVFATADQQAAMIAATRPVRDRLAADPTTGPLLARIIEIVEGADPPEPVTSCEDAAADAAPGAELTAYDGVWRFEVTYQDGLDAGLPADVAAGDLGVQTVRLDGGSYDWEWRSRNRGTQTCTGTYHEEDGLLVFDDETGMCCGGNWEARPSLAGAEISWTDVRTRIEGDPVDQTVRSLLHSEPWRKVEEIPPAAALPEGVYRWQVDEEDLLAAGADGGTATTTAG